MNSIVKYKQAEQEQIRQRIKRQQELIRNKRDEQARIFEQHNIARKQHQKKVQEEHLRRRDEKRNAAAAPVLPKQNVQKPEETKQNDAILEQTQDAQINHVPRYFDKTKHYYVCSYGGCGSKMLVEYLSHFGNVYHIHSRYPPEKLQYIGNTNNQNTYINQYEWFIPDSEIPEDQLSNYTVIYIYRNPINAIYSRFSSLAHLQNIQCKNINLQISDIIDSSSDLYGIEEFFDNYMDSNTSSRNYTIYGIKYDHLFENMGQFNTFFNLPDDPKLYPVKKETDRERSLHHYLLEIIYGNLIRKMDAHDFITGIVQKYKK